VTPDGTARVVYTDTNLNVDELYLTPDGQPWREDTLVQGAPAAASGPFGYVTPDGTARVVYADTNLNIDELYLTPDGQPWREDQLVQGAPAAATYPFAYVTPDGTARVVYTDTAGHIDELYLLPGGAPNLAGSGARPAVSEQPQAAHDSTGTASPSAAAADSASFPTGAQPVAATGHEAALIDQVWSDAADPLLAGPWTDGLA
jgi:hypothetical protein